jgi:hypothetical protein
MDWSNVTKHNQIESIAIACLPPEEHQVFRHIVKTRKVNFRFGKLESRGDYVGFQVSGWVIAGAYPCNRTPSGSHTHFFARKIKSGVSIDRAKKIGDWMESWHWTAHESEAVVFDSPLDAAMIAAYVGNIVCEVEKT